MFVIGFGNNIVQSYYQVSLHSYHIYVQYYAQDTLSLPLVAFDRWTIQNSEQAASLFTLSTLIGSALAAYPAGNSIE